MIDHCLRRSAHWPITSPPRLPPSRYRSSPCQIKSVVRTVTLSLLTGLHAYTESTGCFLILPISLYKESEKTCVQICRTLLHWLRRLFTLCWQFNDPTDIFIKQRFEFYLNNTIYPRSLTPHIMPSYTHSGDRIVAIEKQEAQLSPRNRAMRRVNWNLANCHATVQKLLIRQVLTESMVWVGDLVGGNAW